MRVRIRENRTTTISVPFFATWYFFAKLFGYYATWKWWWLIAAQVPVLYEAFVR